MNKRAALNFASSLMYQFVNLLIGLILPKFYTEAFGSVYNGLNQSVSQIMSLLSVLQFGIAAAAIQQMFKYIADKDEDTIRAIYWESGRQYRNSYPRYCYFPIYNKGQFILLNSCSIPSF